MLTPVLPLTPIFEGWCGQQDSHCTNTNNLNKGWGKQNDFKAYYRECLGLVPTPTPTATFAPKSDTKMDTMTLAIVVVTVALVVLSSIYFRRCRNDGRSADVDTEGIGLGTLPSDPSVMGSPTNVGSWKLGHVFRLLCSIAN